MYRNVRRSFGALVKEAHVLQLTPHGLRPTHASQFLLSGIHPKAVSERLGHASVAFTMRRYIHVCSRPSRRRPLPLQICSWRPHPKATENKPRGQLTHIPKSKA